MSRSPGQISTVANLYPSVATMSTGAVYFYQRSTIYTRDRVER
ncbi:hypothetical protein CKA32_006218 [Geitlerinema sp. FC II]|nr:hypothetical protein [Geitlerinema sp. CS-897]PPT10539.1 hypothetical protein CKA32_006218 [Geitlerinema sp. FC II]